MAEIPPKGILKSDALKKYVFETSAYPREHEQLRELREATADKYGNRSEMAVPVDEGHFLSMLVKILNAKKTLEIGVFTGYSLLATALALPPDGQIVAIDSDREAFEFGLQFIKAAGVDHKINFVNSSALSILDEMLNNGTQRPEFDFVFVDADKPSYVNYHEKLLEMVKVGGVIAYDNTLWYGFVSEEEDEVPEHMRFIRKHIMDFNGRIASDHRVEVSQVSIGDGVTLCRRVV